MFAALPETFTSPLRRPGLVVGALIVVISVGVATSVRLGGVAVDRLLTGRPALAAAVVALAGLRAPTTGVLRWNGEVIGDPSAFLRPPRSALVSQVPRLVSGTVIENVALDRVADVHSALLRAELGQDVERWGGAHTRIGHRGLRLSGGQSQRLATARALAADSELLVLDDLSSALDVVTEARVWANLRELGQTVVAASHKEVALRAADRVVVLDAGRVVADGTPDEVRTSLVLMPFLPR